MPKLLTLAAISLLALSAFAQESQLLTDFSADLPTDESSATVNLVFQEIRPMSGIKAGAVVAQLRRRGGQWVGPHRAAADYNQNSAGSAEIKDLKFEGDVLSGTLHLMIDKDRPRPSSPGGFPTPPDQFDVQFEAKIQRGTPLPYQDDPEQYMPPWRKDTPKFGGHTITGTYKATWGQGKTPADVKKTQAVEGKVLGAINAAPAPGLFGADGNVSLSKAKSGGVAMTARLAPRRVASPEGARILKEWDQPSDWTRFTGLRITVASPKKRDDAAVAVAIRESDGTWYSASGAAMLLGREATFTVPFADFRRGGFDENYFLDVSGINALSIGIDNPMGVGDVEFEVRKIELYREGEGFGPKSQKPVTIRIEPDVAISLDGAREIPKGLFGFHHVGNPKPATRPTDPDPVAFMKQINPGYLRPLDHVGFGGAPITDEQIKQLQSERIASKTKPDSLMFRRFEAANALDNMVWCHTVDLWSRPPWMDADFDKFIDGVKAFYRHVGAKAWVPGDDFNPLRRLEVWNEPFIWGRHINMGPKTPGGRKNWEDPTQFGYIPGKVGSDVYSKIFLAAVESAKGANPHVLLGGPSAPGFNGDDYSNFENHAARFIDACHDKIDFITEHHYGGEPDSYAASYFVCTAYTDVKYGKRFPIYNTECNDLTDPATRGDDGMKAAQARMLDLNRAHYNIEDILECIRVDPSTIVGRAMHALWYGWIRNPGEEAAYTIISNLRGTMIAASADDPAIRVVAASPAEGMLVLFLFNDSNFDRELLLPEGLQGFSIREHKLLSFKDGITLGTPPADASSKRLSLPSRNAMSITLAKPGYKPSAVRTFEQSYADINLARVKPDAPAKGKILWRGHGPAGGKSAVLRVVTRGVDRGEAVAIINGKSIELPWSTANDGDAVLQEITIDPAILQPQTTIEFRCTDPANANGFTVWAAGVMVER